MRRLLAAVVAIPFIVVLYLSSLVQRAFSRRTPQSGATLRTSQAVRSGRVPQATEPLRASQALRTNQASKTSQVVETGRAPQAAFVAKAGPVVKATPAVRAGLPPRRTPSGPSLFSGPLRLPVAVGATVLVLVSGMLIGLPAKEVAGGVPPTFAPLAPQAEATRGDNSLSLNVPFEVRFTKPMNEATVEGALSVSPSTNLRYTWDATAQVLSIAPDPYWAPHTTYRIDIGPGATDQEGLSLASEIHTSFDTGELTSGTITATQKSGDLTSPLTAFQLTFTRPVKLSTVLLRYTITPAVPVSIVGDDPTDAASMVFTMTPKSQLASNIDYTVAMAAGGTDSAGADLALISFLTVRTMTAPSVVRFRPQAGGYTNDTNQPVSVRFTMAMDKVSTAAAFSVTANGKAVAGSAYWAEDDTVLVLTPRSSFAIGAKVVATVSTAARSADGLHLKEAASATFTVDPPHVRAIPFSDIKATSTSPWYASEFYYLQLMNCTRTGGWVTADGSCSSNTHHTLPAQSNNLILDAGISNNVARPYAKYMADNRLLDHYLLGTNPQQRMCNKGYCGPSWGENIASPGNYGRGGMIDIEVFYQNEYPCRCEHYYNIMSPYYRRVGIGVWYSNSVRVAIEFYS